MSRLAPTEQDRGGPVAQAGLTRLLAGTHGIEAGERLPGSAVPAERQATGLADDRHARGNVPQPRSPKDGVPEDPARHHSRLVADAAQGPQLAGVVAQPAAAPELVRVVARKSHEAGGLGLRFFGGSNLLVIQERPTPQTSVEHSSAQLEGAAAVGRDALASGPGGNREKDRPDYWFAAV